MLSLSLLLARYFFKKGQIKMKDTEINISDVKFVVSNMII